MKKSISINQYIGKVLAVGLLISAVGVPGVVNGQEMPDSQEEPVIEESSDAEIDEAKKEIPVTAAYFPDKYFRKYISQNVDTDKNGTLSDAEIKACTKVEISGSTDLDGKWRGTVEGPVKDLTGIGYLTSLDWLELSCYDDIESEPSLKQIDLSQNTELTYLDVRVGLKELDVSKNQKLKTLMCYGNGLNSLNLSQNKELENLNCMYNNLTSLDVSHNSNLSVLFFEHNPISSLTLGDLPKLEAIDYGYTKIKNIDLSPYQNQLITIGCSGLELKKLDVSNYPKLVFLTCDDNQLTSLDLSKNPDLSILSCRNNRLAYVDVSQNKKYNQEYSPERYVFEVGGNVYPAAFDDKGQFDLSKIPGFQVSKVSNLKGGKISGTVLTLDAGSNKVTYTYDCGFTYKGEKLQNAEFTITNTNASSITPTEAFCARLYTLCLGRKADQDGIDYWTAQLQNGTQTGASVGYGFVFSDEYKKKNTSDEAFVKMLYEVFMDRSADKGGFDYWVGLLGQGMSREYVYKGFAESQEYTNICNSYGIVRGSIKLKQARDYNLNLTKYINQIYEKALNRKGEEDGLNFWCGQIQTKAKTPVQVAEAFFFSPEFTNNNLNNTEYVKVLYRTFMGREADQGGMNYWVERLNKGESRKSVLEAFAGCPEFQKIVKSFGL